MILNLRYQLQNLRIRGVRSTFTVLGVGLVVAVFCYLQCFADGLRRALARSGDPRNVIVLAEAATAESNSVIFRDDLHKLEGIPHVARNAARQALVSPEFVVQTNVWRRGDPSRAPASVVVRGVDPEVALQVHGGTERGAGRWFHAGTDELVVGAAAARQFANVTIGSKVECGERTFTIVGIFRAGGGVHESELWGYFANVADAYRRKAYSSATVRLQSADRAALAEANERIASAGIALRAVPEPDYFASQGANARVLEVLALGLVVIMGAGAVFAAMNTMHAAVAGRTHEIGMLRAIGFSAPRIMLGILTESLLLAVGGGIIGCATCAAVILLDRATKDLVGSATFTSVAFRVDLSGANLALSLAIAAAIGVLGGFWPARAASRMPVVDALRVA
jgi:putative ABC transport system permease protein